MQNQEDSDFSLEDSQQDEAVVDPPNNLPVEPQIPVDSGLSLREKQSNEVLYIIFTTYRKDVEEIAKRYNCQIRVSMSTYMVSNSDSNKKEEFAQCCKEISAFVNSINFEKLGAIWKIKGQSANLSEKVRYNYSPYFSELLRSKNIAMLSFQEDVFAFSRKLNKEQIKYEFLRMSKDKFIFPVKYNRSQKTYKAYNPEIYKEVNAYLEKTFVYYEEFLNERNIIAELSKQKTFVYLVGEKQKFLMEAKSTMKNVVESLVCLIVKNTIINDKTLGKFLQKASAYPIHFARLNQKQCLIISKDNILKQLIIKSAGFFKHVGIDIPDQPEGVISANVKIGIFVIHSHTFKTKIQNSRNVCKQIGYDLFINNGIYYINQVFYQEGTQKKDVIRKLLGDILMALESSKQKFETMTKIKQKEKQKTKEDDNPLKYVLKGGRQTEKTLSQAMRRDVLTEKVQMKKQHSISYNIIQTKEKKQYWVLEKSGEAGEQVSESDLKPGRYLKGWKRVAQDGTVGVLFEEIITVI